MAIIINGKSYNGNNITIGNGEVIIDGVKQTPENEKNIIIIVNGDINTLSVDACSKLDVNGNVTELRSVSGDVRIEGDVFGNVNSISGNVKCNNIKGNVSTVSGNIKH